MLVAEKLPDIQPPKYLNSHTAMDLCITPLHFNQNAEHVEANNYNWNIN